MTNGEYGERSQWTSSIASWVEEMNMHDAVWGTELVIPQKSDMNPK